MVDTVVTLTADIVRRANAIAKSGGTAGELPFKTATQIAALLGAAKGLHSNVGYLAGSTQKLVSLVSQLQVATPVPPPVDTTPPPDTPPPTLGSIPTGRSDPRYAKNTPHDMIRNASGTYRNLTIIDNSGEPMIGYQNFQLYDSVLVGREGPRIAGSNILLQGCYIEVGGVSPDHGDGLQAYAPGSHCTNIMLRDTWIHMIASSGQNCGLFLADKSSVDLALENVKIDGGEHCPNGAIWLPNRPGDEGCHSVSYKNVQLFGCNRGVAGIDYVGGGTRPLILAWENVFSDGKPVPRPY